MLFYWEDISLIRENQICKHFQFLSGKKINIKNKNKNKKITSYDTKGYTQVVLGGRGGGGVGIIIIIINIIIAAGQNQDFKQRAT